MPWPMLGISHLIDQLKLHSCAILFVLLSCVFSFFKPCDSICTYTLCLLFIICLIYVKQTIRVSLNSLDIVSSIGASLLVN